MGLIGGLLSDSEETYGTKVAENDEWTLYTNEMTKLYQKDLDSYNEHGFTLQGRFMVVLAVRKSDEHRTYLAMDNRTGRPYMDWNDHYIFDAKKVCILEDLREESDIVNMAKNKLEKDKEAENEI